MLFETDIKRGAEFSPCRTWRYALWREWGFDGKFVAFLGLNPSTADETIDDPTIKRCIRFAKDWGYDGLLMLNAYGFRATKPRVMKAATDPNGPGNDEAILIRIAQAELVVAAWGVHCEATRTAKHDADHALRRRDLPSRLAESAQDRQAEATWGSRNLLTGRDAGVD